MERRDLLKLGGSLALIAAGGGWVLTRSEGGDAPLDRALAHARRTGKPVLVLVAPPPPESSAAVGEAFADAIAFGGDELLLALLTCELACATPAQISQVVGVDPATDELGRIEIDGESLQWRRIEFDTRPWSQTREDPAARDGRNVEALRSALLGDDALLTRRAESARTALGAERIAALDSRLARGDSLDDSDLIDAAAWVRAHPKWEAQRAAAIAAAQKRMLDAPPRGSRWAESAGCAGLDVQPLPGDDYGVRYDLQRRANYDSPAFRIWPGRPLPNPFKPASSSAGVFCGMAFGGRRSNRFLFFYVDEP